LLFLRLDHYALNASAARCDNFNFNQSLKESRVTPRNPFRVARFPQLTFVIPGLPKLNPGLKFANTFGVNLRTPSV